MSAVPSMPTPRSRLAATAAALAFGREGVMSGAVKGSIAVVARLAIALIFLWSGAGKLLAPEGTAAYMHQFGVPLAAMLVWAATTLELGGGLALVIGWQTRLSAAAIALYTLVAALIFHAFWATDAAHALDAQIHFMKNVAIFGGLLMLVAHGAGRYSLDARRAGGWRTAHKPAVG